MKMAPSVAMILSLSSVGISGCGPEHIKGELGGGKAQEARLIEKVSSPIADRCKSYLQACRNGGAMERYFSLRFLAKYLVSLEPSQRRLLQENEDVTISLAVAGIDFSLATSVKETPFRKKGNSVDRLAKDVKSPSPILLRLLQENEDIAISLPRLTQPYLPIPSMSGSESPSKEKEARHVLLQYIRKRIGTSASKLNPETRHGSVYWTRDPNNPRSYRRTCQGDFVASRAGDSLEIQEKDSSVYHWSEILPGRVPDIDDMYVAVAATSRYIAIVVDTSPDSPATLTLFLKSTNARLWTTAVSVENSYALAGVERWPDPFWIVEIIGDQVIVFPNELSFHAFALSDGSWRSSFNAYPFSDQFPQRCY